MMTALPNYYVTGYPFDGVAKPLTVEQANAANELLRLFWGDDRSSRITISIRYRGERGAGTRCSENFPVCWTRVHDPKDCSCSGFEPERGGNEIVITRGKPRKRAKREASAAAGEGNP